MCVHNGKKIICKKETVKRTDILKIEVEQLKILSNKTLLVTYILSTGEWVFLQ